MTIELFDGGRTMPRLLFDGGRTMPRRLFDGGRTMPRRLFDGGRTMAEDAGEGGHLAAPEREAGLVFGARRRPHRSSMPRAHPAHIRCARWPGTRNDLLDNHFRSRICFTQH
jgi:hypothetical protein